MRLKQAYATKCIHLGQKFRDSWVKYGDKSTSFFHSYFKYKASQLAIREIKEESGRILTNQSEIKKAINEFYIKKLTKSQVSTNEEQLSLIPNLVTDDNNTLLCTPNLFRH